MNLKYVHTNIVAKDWNRVSLFYQRVFGLRPVPPVRDLRGDWLDKLTGIKGAHITGEHLALPGYEKDHPTLEIFSYDSPDISNEKRINGTGFAHIAFEVEDVAKALSAIRREGGGQIGDVVKTVYPGGKTAVFVYATDIEGNIIELQSWE